MVNRKVIQEITNKKKLSRLSNTKVRWQLFNVKLAIGQKIQCADKYHVRHLVKQRKTYVRSFTVEADSGANAK